MLEQVQGAAVERIGGGQEDVGDLPGLEGRPLLEAGAQGGRRQGRVDEDAGLAKVIAFTNAWARELPNMKDILIVRYEDLRANTAGELARVLRFMGSEPSEAELADCVAFASVENMRALETKKVFWLSGSRMLAKDKSNPDSFKVRRAKVGGWRDYFEAEQAAAIERTIENSLLPGFGYLSSEKRADAQAAE